MTAASPMDDLSVSKLLLRQESLGVDFTGSTKPALHFAFGIDEKYARHMGVLIASLAVNNSDYALILHVFTESLRQEDHQRLSLLADQYSLSLTLYYISADILQKLPVTVQYPTAIYYRLLMPGILHGRANRVLYLDSDIVCIGHLPNFEALEMDSHPAAAVMDVARVAQKRIANLGLKLGIYFNSGVMLIDTGNWQKANISACVLDILRERGSTFAMMDQDALNVVLEGRVTLLPSSWNQIYSFDHRTSTPSPDTILLHFAGVLKPWHLSASHPLGEIYRRYKVLSPWSSVAPAPLSGYREMEVYARLSFREQDYLTGLYWYWRYLKTKFL